MGDRHTHTGDGHTHLRSWVREMGTHTWVGSEQVLCHTRRERKIMRERGRKREEKRERERRGRWVRKRMRERIWERKKEKERNTERKIEEGCEVCERVGREYIMSTHLKQLPSDPPFSLSPS